MVPEGQEQTEGWDVEPVFSTLSQASAAVGWVATGSVSAVREWAASGFGRSVEGEQDKELEKIIANPEQGACVCPLDRTAVCCQR